MKMKYKVGDKVRIRKDLKKRQMLGGMIVTSEMAELAGATLQVKGINLGNVSTYELDGYTQPFWTDEMLEPYTFTKADLMTGDVVETKHGKMYSVNLNTGTEDSLIGKRGFEVLKNYMDDLTNVINRDYDIVKVSRPKSTYQMVPLNWEEMPVIWEREKPIIELTLEEIAKLKGVDVDQIRIKE